MTLEQMIYELIGVIANVAVAAGGTQLRLNELAGILTTLDIESDLWDHYKSRTDGLIRKAYDYFLSKGDTQTAGNIKSTYVKKDGTSVAP